MNDLHEGVQQLFAEAQGGEFEAMRRVYGKNTGYIFFNRLPVCSACGLPYGHYHDRLGCRPPVRAEQCYATGAPVGRRRYRLAPGA